MRYPLEQVCKGGGNKLTSASLLVSRSHSSYGSWCLVCNRIAATVSSRARLSAGVMPSMRRTRTCLDWRWRDRSWGGDCCLISTWRDGLLDSNMSTVLETSNEALERNLPRCNMILTDPELLVFSCLAVTVFGPASCVSTVDEKSIIFCLTPQGREFLSRTALTLLSLVRSRRYHAQLLGSGRSTHHLCTGFGS